MDDAERERAFELHHEEQRRAFLKLTPRERLAWLEEAKRFAAVAIAAARRRASSDPPRRTP